MPTAASYILPDPENFESMRQYVVDLFPPQLDPLQATAAQQEQELASLKRTVGSERFYFVVDLTRFEMTHRCAIERWLGYPEKEFSLRRYWQLVHPGMQIAVHSVFQQLLGILCRGHYELSFMVQRYSSLIALRHARGGYVLAKRTASVFQYDQSNRLTEYLNEFTIIGPYQNEPLSPMFFTDRGEPEKERGGAVLNQAMTEAIGRFLRMKTFTPRELEMVRALIYEPRLTKRALAERLDLASGTVDTFCKRFLVKARDHFEMEFESVLQAARYLKDCGLI